MASFPPVSEQLELLSRGTQEILPKGGLEERLKSSYESGKPMTVKLGCDPSRPDLHLGHSVVLRKLRQFQDMGHNAVLIIGDFTAMIGDPTGRSKTRPALTVEQTRAYGESYFQQASLILDTEKLQIKHNSDWLDAMSFSDVVRLASRYTVARMLERDDFENRYKNNEPISVHEFLYPLAQGQDSVALESDVELGGTDQKFNLLVGRDLQMSNGQTPQICMTLPILEGTDGVEKMSKSLDNYIGLSDAPEEMYGKTLSIPDNLIYRYFELTSDLDTAELERVKSLADSNPRDAKHELAFVVSRMYHGKEAAAAARAHFERTVINKDIPESIEEYRLTGSGSVGILHLIRDSGMAASNGEARRLVQQGAVSTDGVKIDDVGHVVEEDALPFVLKVGKRRFRRIV